jgi:hypothetical protein
VRDVIIAVQRGHGARIERILGAGGGQITVLDRVDDQDDQTADELSETVTVALIFQKVTGTPVAQFA